VKGSIASVGVAVGKRRVTTRAGRGVAVDVGVGVDTPVSDIVGVDDGIG
jgi:hypothetical protein